MPLTALQVKNAKPGRHADGKGLYLLVKPKLEPEVEPKRKRTPVLGPDGQPVPASKSWVLRVMAFDSKTREWKRRDFGLGPVDLVPLTEAREKAVEGRKLAKAGKDPALEWKREQHSIPTFKEVAERFHSEVKEGWRNGKHGDQWINTLKTHAFPKIGAKPVDEIDANIIQSVLLPIWLTIPETARRVRQRIFKVLDYSKGKGWRETEAPARSVNSLMKAIKQPKGRNFPAMPYEKLPPVMAKLRASDQTMTRRAVQFNLLTAARPGEVRGARWAEIDWDAAQWNIPGERMKAGEPHSVPLVPAAMDILRELRDLLGADPAALIFPSMKRGKMLSDVGITKAFRLAGGTDTLHGTARSSFRDWVAEKTSFPGEWAEAALAHALPNKVEAAYRRTKFIEQRRTLMAAWADYLDGKNNVIALSERRA